MTWSESVPYLLADAVRSAHSGPQQLARLQQSRLHNLVHHARTASPFYRHRYRSVPSHVEDITELPVLDKPTLMSRFDDWVTDPDVTLEDLRTNFLAHEECVGQLYLGRYLVMTTSGTTGEPAVLLHDRLSWRVYNIVGRTRPQSIVGRIDLAALARRGMRTVALFATGGHFGAVTFAERVRRISPFLSDRTRVLSVLRPLDDLVAELNEFQPTLLSGYPSIFVLLAAEQRAGRLRIEPVHILCAGELFTPTMRHAVSDTFGCPVTEGYAATEVPGLSIECTHGFLHVNSDWYILEPVDSDRRPVPPGVQSDSVLVTNLSNRIQPIIRYDLGDRVTLQPHPCACSSPFPVVTVEGRTNEVLTFDDSDHQPVQILPLALGSVIEESPGVHRFQAIETGPRELTIRLDVDDKATRNEVQREVERRVRDFLRSHRVTDVTITCASEAPRQEPRSGKLRQVLRS
jgi:phenylacetate-coenzyme A ligase PaaK-like adenylate-forming protein